MRCFLAVDVCARDFGSLLLEPKRWFAADGRESPRGAEARAVPRTLGRDRVSAERRPRACWRCRRGEFVLGRSDERELILFRKTDQQR